MARSIKKGPFIEKKLYKRVVEMSKAGDKRMINTAHLPYTTAVPVHLAGLRGIARFREDAGEHRRLFNAAVRGLFR